MKRLSIGACLLGGLLSVGAATAAPSIVSGQSVGRISLGMRHSMVVRLLGAPIYARTLRSSQIPGPHPAGDYEADAWLKSTTVLGPVLTVTLRNDRVVQIETSSPKFSTADDLSINTPFSTLRRRYPHMRVDTYGVREGIGGEEGGGFLKYYIDSIGSGIAFTMETQLEVYDVLPTSTPDSIIVHLPGERFLPTFAESRQHVDVDPSTASTSHSIPNVRAWFAGGPHRKDIHED